MRKYSHMKRYLFLLLTLLSLNSFAQDYNLEFGIILNEYRKSHNIPPVKFDTTLKNFADSHVRYMSEVNSVTHGEDSSYYGFLNRWKRIPNYKQYHIGENCTELIIPQQNNNGRIRTNIEELTVLLNKMKKNGVTSHDMANYALILWKNSSDHNKLLLNPDMKYYYLTTKKNSQYVYCELICFNKKL